MTIAPPFWSIVTAYLLAMTVLGVRMWRTLHDAEAEQADDRRYADWLAAREALLSRPVPPQDIDTDYAAGGD